MPADLVVVFGSCNRHHSDPDLCGDIWFDCGCVNDDILVFDESGDNGDDDSDDDDEYDEFYAPLAWDYYQFRVPS